MCTHAIERYKGAFQTSLLLYAGKKSQPDARIMHTSSIIMSSCWINQWYQTIMCERNASIRIIQWILYSPGTRGMEKLSTLPNSKVSEFGSIFKYCINNASVGTASNGHVSEVATIGRCMLREVPLWSPLYVVHSSEWKQIHREWIVHFLATLWLLKVHTLYLNVLNKPTLHRKWKRHSQNSNLDLLNASQMLLPLSHWSSYWDCDDA